MIAIPAFSEKTWKIIGICAGLLFVLGAVLFTMDRCGGYWSGRSLDKARANVNAALANANAQKGVVANDKVDEAVALEKVKEAVNDAVTASNATDEVKAQANAAVDAYVKAKQANVPVGTTEDDLRRKLDALGND